MGNKKPRFKFSLFVLLFLLPILFLMLFLLFKKINSNIAYLESKNIASQSSSNIDSLENKSSLINSEFSLNDINGNIVTNKDFTGKYMLVFFGFTNCPDICPATLSKVSDVISKLDKEKAKQIVPIFISLDPKRDTPEILKEYLKNFDPSVIALTGNKEQIDLVVKNYKIYYEFLMKDNEEDMDYMVNHSVMTYLIGKNSEYIYHFSLENTSEDILSYLNQNIK